MATTTVTTYGRSARIPDDYTVVGFNFRTSDMRLQCPHGHAPFDVKSSATHQRDAVLCPTCVSIAARVNAAELAEMSPMRGAE